MESVSIVPSTTADVDLDADHTPLQVDISDALSEKDKVKFTVHTRFALFLVFFAMMRQKISGRVYLPSRSLSSL